MFGWPGCCCGGFSESSEPCCGYSGTLAATLQVHAEFFGNGPPLFGAFKRYPYLNGAWPLVWSNDITTVHSDLAWLSNGSISGSPGAVWGWYGGYREYDAARRFEVHDNAGNLLPVGNTGFKDRTHLVVVSGPGIFDPIPTCRYMVLLVTRAWMFRYSFWMHDTTLIPTGPLTGTMYPTGANYYGGTAAGLRDDGRKLSLSGTTIDSGAGGAFMRFVLRNAADTANDRQIDWDIRDFKLTGTNERVILMMGNPVATYKVDYAGEAQQLLAPLVVHAVTIDKGGGVDMTCEPVTLTQVPLTIDDTVTLNAVRP